MHALLAALFANQPFSRSWIAVDGEQTAPELVEVEA